MQYVVQSMLASQHTPGYPYIPPGSKAHANRHDDYNDALPPRRAGLRIRKSHHAMLSLLHGLFQDARSLVAVLSAHADASAGSDAGTVAAPGPSTASLAAAAALVTSMSALRSQQYMATTFPTLLRRKC